MEEIMTWEYLPGPTTGYAFSARKSGQRLVEGRVQRHDVGDANQLEGSAGGRTLGDDADADAFRCLVVGGHQNAHTSRGEELHVGQVHDDALRRLREHALDGVLELGGRDHVYDATGGDDRDPADPSLGDVAGRTRCRSCALSCVPLFVQGPSSVSPHINMRAAL